MKLLLLFAAILAISLAEEDKKEIEDSEAAASVELLKEKADLKAEASAYKSYVPSSQQYPQWGVPSVPTVPSYPPPTSWNPPNTWNPPKEPVAPWYPPVQNDHFPTHPTYAPTWSTPHYHPSTTTTPVPVIKNELYYGENGSYKYEYQIGDGTHVAEEGFFTNPKADDESLVKKGWYSYVGADGKTYTVTYYADKTGFHAFGDHLPTPPPVPAAIQAALDKEKEAEKYKPQHDYPTQTQAPIPVHPPVTYPPVTYPPVTYPPVTYPPVQTYPPVHTYPNHHDTYPQHVYYPQPTYPQQQQPHYPNQQQSNPSYGK